MSYKSTKIPLRLGILRCRGTSTLNLIICTYIQEQFSKITNERGLLIKMNKLKQIIIKKINKLHNNPYDYQRMLGILNCRVQLSREIIIYPLFQDGLKENFGKLTLLSHLDQDIPPESRTACKNYIINFGFKNKFSRLILKKGGKMGFGKINPN